MAFNSRSRSLPMPASPLFASPGPAVAGIRTHNSSNVLYSRLSLGTITDFGVGNPIVVSALHLIRQSSLHPPGRPLEGWTLLTVSLVIVYVRTHRIYIHFRQRHV